MSPQPYARVTRPCQACGTWTCAACGWRRPGASRRYPQDCARCGGTDGTFSLTRHAPLTWEQHNRVTGPLCRAWTLFRLDVLGDCRHESCQVIAWEHVIRWREGKGKP